MEYEFSEETVAAAVSTADAKAHMRVLHASEDALITTYVAAATRHVESKTGRSLVTREITYKCDGFPRLRGAIVLPRPPISEVESVSYIDESGAQQTLDTSAFQFVPSSTKCELVPAAGSAWPPTSKSRRSVTVVYSSGYGADAADVPEDIINAILLLVQHFYSHRSAVSEGTAIVTPMAVDALLGPHMTTGWI